MKKGFILLSSLLLVVLILLTISTSKSELTKGTMKIKSVNLSTDYTIKQALNDIDMIGANTVNVPVVINIPSLTSNEMQIDAYSKKKAIQLISQLNKKKVKVILEAYPWISNGSEYETEYNPANKPQFFHDWEKILVTLVKDVGNKYNVYMMHTASNFVALEPYEKEWIEIIGNVKKQYKGLVSYKTSWWYTATWDKASTEAYQKKLNNQLFSKVDVISIAAYFELSHKDLNSVSELTKALRSTTIHNRGQNVVAEIEQFYKKYNKPIFFGELGFPRRSGAAKQPWNSHVTSIENGLEQSRGFQAYKNVFEKTNYILGFSVFAVGEKGPDKFFYPSKETVNVIKSWYH